MGAKRSRTRTVWVMVLWTGLMGACSDDGGPSTPVADVVDIAPIPSPHESIVLVPGEACRPDAPAPGVFTASSSALGIDFTHSAYPPPDGASRMVFVDYAGVAMADLDGDGWLDLYFTGGGVPDRIYRTAGQGPAVFDASDPGIGWPDEEQQEGAALVLPSLAVNIADLDGDGIRDVIVVGEDRVGWFRNDGEAALTYAGSLKPPTLDSGRRYLTVGVATADWDGDGLVDVYVSNHESTLSSETKAWPAEEWFMHNRGGGIFDDRTDWIPVQPVEDKTFLSAMVDLDDDGDVDIYEINDAWSLLDLGLDPTSSEVQGNRVFRNDANDSITPGVHTDVSELSGADIKVAAMGVAVGDYDNDGLPDLYVTAMLPQSNVLLHNEGQLQFTDTTIAMSANTLHADHDVGWGALFLDADSDGWLDLFVAHGYNPVPLDDLENPDQQDNVLLHNGSGQGFEDITEKAQVGGAAWSRSPVVGDLNRDGFPDLVVGNADFPPYIYLNGCDDRPWLTVRLVGQSGNLDGIGARIRVTSPAGLTQTRLLVSGSDGLYGSSASEAYFGFPPGTDTVSLSIRWPGGTEVTHENIPIRHLLVVSEEIPDR
jgi:hypothetical protein